MPPVDPSRPTTPPAQAGPSSRPDPPVTPEHVRLAQQNRLRAKARIQELARAQQRQQQPVTNANGKRPGGPIPLEEGKATSRNAVAAHTPGAGPSPAKPGQTPSASKSAPLPRDDNLGNYIEYDLSKLHNSKGGFLVEEEEGREGRKTLEEITRERERERERQRLAMEPGVLLDPSTQQICRECSSKEIDDQLQRVFAVLVCRPCSKRFPEKYSLLTKTEVKEDYLLTDSELRDPDLLPHLLKANPHKATYSNMMLFMRMQVEAYAFSPAKWGSEDGLDAEFERREEEKSRKRGKKFEQGLRQLRMRTRDNVWQRRKDEEHVHAFEDAGEGKQVCTDCGAEIEVETF